MCVCPVLRRHRDARARTLAPTHAQTLRHAHTHTQVCQVAGNMDDASSFDRTKQALHFIGFDQLVHIT